MLKLHWIDPYFNLNSTHYDKAKTTHDPSTSGKMDVACGYSLVRPQKVLDAVPGTFNCTLNKSWKHLQEK